MTATEVREIGDGLWSFEMPPQQLRYFGGAPTSIGARSIIILSGYEFNDKVGELHFEAEKAIAVNIGTTQTVIGLSAQLKAEQENATVSAIPNPVEGIHGRGDREFIQLCKRELSQRMQSTAITLLNGVRAASAGDLKKGLSRNFSETPDNFWYVILQPRIDQLSITVRGPVDHFEKIARLPIKNDRGNTLFKVTGEKDIPAAMEMIFHAKRKRR